MRRVEGRVLRAKPSSRETGLRLLRVCRYATLGRHGGRMEKRLPIAIVVNLSTVKGQSPNGTELTYTDNVSAHGACVLSSHPWGSGDVADVTSLVDDITLRGKVVHCDKRGEGRYAVGLSFQNGGVFWPVYLRYAGGDKKQSVIGPLSLIGT